MLRLKAAIACAIAFVVSCPVAESRDVDTAFPAAINYLFITLGNPLPLDAAGGSVSIVQESGLGDPADPDAVAQFHDFSDLPGGGSVITIYTDVVSRLHGPAAICDPFVLAAIIWHELQHTFTNYAHVDDDPCGG